VVQVSAVDEAGAGKHNGNPDRQHVLKTRQIPFSRPLRVINGLTKRAAPLEMIDALTTCEPPGKVRRRCTPRVPLRTANRALIDDNNLVSP
jgi:hypothetical protein